MSRVRGTVSVAQLCSASGLGRDKTLKSLQRLIDFGLLEVVGGGAAPKQEPGRDHVPTPDASAGSTRPAGDQPVAQKRERAESSADSARSTKPVADSEPSFKPVQPSRQSTVLGADEEDDLFMPDSIAHISKVVEAPGAGEGSSRNRDRSNAPSGDRGEEDDSEPAPAAEHQAAIAAGDSDLFGSSQPAQKLGDEATAAVADADKLGQTSMQDGDSDLFGGASDDDVDGDSGLFGAPANGVGDEATAQPEDSGERAAAQDSAAEATEKKKKKKGSKEPDLSLFPDSFDDFSLDPSALIEGADIDDALKREIAFVHENLDYVNYYELFGVGPDAGRKEIRSSYFVLSKRYHPDLFFRKDTGPFAEMAEVVFKRVTKAYQILSHKKKRAEYDQSLSDHRMAQDAAAQRDEESAENKREMAVEVLSQRAEKAEAAGDFLTAAETYKKVFALKKDAHIAEKCANLLLRASQRLDEAAMFARVVTRENPGNADAFVLLGRIYEKNEALVEALDAYELALDAAPDDASILVHVERLRSQI